MRITKTVTLDILAKNGGRAECENLLIGMCFADIQKETGKEVNEDKLTIYTKLDFIKKIYTVMVETYE